LFAGISWGGVFGFGVNPIEIIIRGSIMYLGLYVLLRVVLRRETLTFNDVLVLVLLADAAQNGMAGQYRSITDGLLLVGVIIFWSYAMNWLGYHVKALSPVIHPPPLLLVKQGRLIPENLGRELVTWEELMTELRMQGVKRLDEVDRAYFEGNGQITVLRREEKGGGKKSEGKKDEKSKGMSGGAGGV